MEIWKTLTSPKSVLITPVPAITPPIFTPPACEERELNLLVMPLFSALQSRITEYTEYMHILSVMLEILLDDLLVYSSPHSILHPDYVSPSLFPLLRLQQPPRLPVCCSLSVISHSNQKILTCVIWYFTKVPPSLHPSHLVCSSLRLFTSPIHPLISLFLCKPQYHCDHCKEWAGLSGVAGTFDFNLVN